MKSLVSAVCGLAGALTLQLGAAWAQQAIPTPPRSSASAVRTPADDDVKTTTQRLIVGRPTLLSAGFEWMINGDSNRTASVAVTYRKKGETAWKPALPMLRLQFEEAQEILNASRQKTLHPVVVNYTAPNAFAGSVMNLQPDTDYEFHFVLKDPDGVVGETEKTVALKTRPEPMPAAGGRVFHVYPFDYKGPKQEPAFVGLMDAYYVGSFDADYWNGYPPRVRAGDTILVHAGEYKDTAFRYYYGHTTPVKGEGPLTPYGTFFDGTYYLHANGTPDKPIVIKAAGDGEVIFDGNNVAVLFDLTRANYNYFEGITVRNADIAFLLGRKAYWGADGFTLKHSKLYDIARGVHNDWGLAKDYYIADNEFIGRTPPDRLIGYGSPELYGDDPQWPVPLNMKPWGSEYAVKVYGQGHVVAYNLVKNWHDGIDIATYGNPDATCHECYGDSGDVPPPTTEEQLVGNIDFYGNDISNMNDNCFEGDGGARNIRVFANRCFNDTGPPFSVDPGYGGPFYYFGNIVYNAVGGFPACSTQCSGAVFYNNTIFGEVRGGNSGSGNFHLRNNLIVAAGAIVGNAHSQTGAFLKEIYDKVGVVQGSGPNGKPLFPVFGVTTHTAYSSSDYNGFTLDPRAPIQFRWTSPPDGVVVDWSYEHPMVNRTFKNLAEYQAAMGQDRHSRIIPLSDFTKVRLPDREHYQNLYDPKDFDFALKAGSKAIDAGVVLPTINDGYVGKAPDLGALERGKPEPHFGPRS